MCEVNRMALVERERDPPYDPAAMSEPDLTDPDAQKLQREQMLYWFGVAALWIAAFICYSPSMRGDYLWDDDVHVTNNRALRLPNGIERLWIGVTDPKTYPVPQFYPMTHISFWMQTRFAQWYTPPASWPFHLVNVVLHVLSAWMLWTVLRRLDVPGAFVVAAIWLVHPVQVESVAWITERKNVLSAFFMFGSMIVYLRYCGLDVAPSQDDPAQWKLLPREPWKLYTLAIILFVCSILSKSVTGSMPAVIL